MTAKTRVLAGGAALAAGLWLLTAATAAPPPIPKESAKKAADADIASLQALLKDIAAAPDKSKGAIRTAKALTVTLATYGDEGTQGQAAKVLAALDKKDWKGAADAANGFAGAKPNAAAVKAMEGKYTLEDVMSPFRVSKSGGMNIEKDIRDARKAGKIDPAAAELIGARSAALADAASRMPNEKAAGGAKKQEWEKLCKTMITAAKDLTDEAAKGAGADQKKMNAAITRLDATCTDCHGKYRDDN